MIHRRFVNIANVDNVNDGHRLVPPLGPMVGQPKFTPRHTGRMPNGAILSAGQY